MWSHSYARRPEAHVLLIAQGKTFTPATPLMTSLVVSIWSALGCFWQVGGLKASNRARDGLLGEAKPEQAINPAKLYTLRIFSQVRITITYHDFETPYVPSTIPTNQVRTPRLTLSHKHRKPVTLIC